MQTNFGNSFMQIIQGNNSNSIPTIVHYIVSNFKIQAFKFEMAIAAATSTVCACV